MERDEVQKMIDEAIKRALGDMAAQTAEVVRETVADMQRPKVNVSAEQSRDLLARAGAVSVDVKSEVADMIYDGKTEPEILRFITDKATGNPDAKDTGDLPNGTGKEDTKRQAHTGPVQSFDEVDDDTFFRSLSNPAAMSVH